MLTPQRLFNLYFFQVPDEVEQLDQLRKATGAKATKLVEVESSRIVNVDGQVQASSNKEKAVKDAQTGATLASVKEASELEQSGPGERPHSVSRTQLDVPALGIHETKVEDSRNSNNLQRQLQQQQLLPGPGLAEKKNYVPYSWNAEEPDRTDYTPTDLAEYILRTGDEEGVAIAVEELLRQGMMTREEAIVYLQDVKAEMNYIRAQQEKLRKIQELREAINMKKKDEFKAQRRPAEALRTREMEHSPKVPVASKSSQKAAQAPNSKAAAAEKPKSPAAKAAASKEVTPQGSSKAGGSSKAADSSSLSTAAKTAGEDKNKASQHQASASSSGTQARKRGGERMMLPGGLAPNKLSVLELERLAEEQRVRSAQQQAEEDVLGALKKLRGSSLYDEYTLEEIIYWLAKDMFAHSIVKGDQSAEEALARFANFVETEVSQNKLSGEVEKKVLDIMLAALVDMLREFPSSQYSGPVSNQLPQRLFPEATEHQAAKLANARVRNAAIRLREEKKKTIPAVIKHKEVPTASQKS
ncbi:uncharacterized protein LOC142583504 [Dermacentor variabilis]|uniref:uncharacterized protein LOC142583504 n=1 Tax=Dermacentor variabilis TaxID=34621 RepID=UPI003F5AFDA1